MTLPTLTRLLWIAGCAGSAALAPGAQQAPPEPLPVRTARRTETPQAEAQDARRAAAEATRRQAETHGPPILRVLDVSDLIQRPDTDSATEPTTDQPPGAAPEQPSRTAKQLARYCARFVEPALAPGEEIAAVGPHLVLYANPASQSSALSILSAFRTRSREQIVVELRVIELTEERYGAVLAPHLRGSFRIDAKTPDQLVDAPQALLENSEATTALIRRVTAEADVLSAPHILMQAGQRAQVESGNRIAYVRDFDVEVAQGAFIADPVIDTVFDGLSFQTVAGPLPRNRLGVDLEITNGSVQQPIPTFETTIGTALPVTIQLPTSILHRLRATVALPDRGIAIFALPKFGDAGAEKRRIVTLQARRVQ